MNFLAIRESKLSHKVGRARRPRVGRTLLSADFEVEVVRTRVAESASLEVNPTEPPSRTPALGLSRPPDSTEHKTGALFSTPIPRRWSILVEGHRNAASAGQVYGAG